MSPEMQSNLDIVCSQITKTFGKGSIMRLTDKADVDPEGVIDTGSISLDIALGIGGYARGRIVEIYGQESTGKSTLCLHAIANAQKKGITCAYLDVEHCLTGETLVYNNTTGRYETVLELLEKKEFSIIGTNSKKEIIQSNAHIKPANIRDIYELKAERGRIIKVSEDHKILTNMGYKKIQEITPGEYIYTVAEIPNFNGAKTDIELSEKEKEKYRLLGLFIGDGCFQESEISNIDSEIIKDFTNIVAKNFNCKTEIRKTSICASAIDGSRYHFDKETLVDLFLNKKLTVSEIKDMYSCEAATIRRALLHNGIIEKDFNFRKHASNLRNKKRERIVLEKQELPTKKNALSEFLNGFECFNKHSKERRLPPNLTLPQLKEVLAGIFLSDGTSVDPEKQKRCTGSFSTSSRILALDIQASLQKIGITSQLYFSSKKKNENEYYDKNYRVSFNGREQVLKFLENIPIYGDKRKKLEEACLVVGQCDKIYKEGNLVKLLVKSVEKLQTKEMTYDISVHRNSFEEQNYLAEGMIVHNSLDKAYSVALGVDIDKLLFSQPDFGEQALGIADMLVKSGEVGLIIVDSVAALVAQKELDGEIGDSNIGLQARLMSQAMRMLAGRCDRSNCTIIFTNQIRNKVAVMHGSPNTTSGGLALKFYASQRLEIFRIGDVKDKEEVIGNRTKVKVVKNKLAPPKKEVEFSIVFGKGVDPYLEVLQLGIEDGLVLKSGAWYKYGDSNVAQGEVAALRWLKDNEEIYKSIKEQLLEARGLK
jgi:protein RecA